MLLARDFFDQEIWWEPRAGQVSVWFDNWTQLGALYFHPHIDHVQEHIEEVHQLMDKEGWNMGRLHDNFSEEVCSTIQQILGRGQTLDERDKVWWMPIGNGDFIVGSAWELVRHRQDKKENIMHIWEKGIPFKVSFMMWRLWYEGTCRGGSSKNEDH
ncbi:hypothetical protein KY284_029025 [Solanum tuberosum]|nr:hypothetical protein KY284_029025 [Solanum tuberosum]